MKYPDRVTMCVSSAGRVRLWAARFCATGQAGADQGNLSTAGDRRPGLWRGERTVTADAPRAADGHLACLQYRLHGHGASPWRTTRTSSARIRRLTDPVPGGPRQSRSARSPCRRLGLVPGDQTADGGGAGRPPSPSRCTPPDDEAPRRACSRSTAAGRWPRSSTRPWDYAAATGRRVSIEYALIRDINGPSRGALTGWVRCWPGGSRT